MKKNRFLIYIWSLLLCYIFAYIVAVINNLLDSMSIFDFNHSDILIRVSITWLIVVLIHNFKFIVTKFKSFFKTKRY